MIPNDGDGYGLALTVGVGSPVANNIQDVVLHFNRGIIR